MTIKFPDYPAPAFAMAPRAVTEITDLIIHHSDGSPFQSALDIDTEHRSEGWAMIGYNYIISGDGTISKGRPDNVVPSAAYGRNEQSVDVCLLGDFEPGTPGASPIVPILQQASLKDLAVYLHNQYPTIVRTIGHRDVGPMFYPGDTGPYATACPGQILYDQIPALKAYVFDKIKSQ
jgi:N-acetylmuramoyl-L-alanine amidase